MRIDGGSHLGVIDRSSSSKWHIWFLRQCWLQFCSDIVGSRQSIRCIFSSGKWVYQGLIIVVDLLQYSWWRWRKSSRWYRRWAWCDWCWCWSGCRSFGWCQSVGRWVRVTSLLGSRPNSRCRVTGTQSEQLFFEQENVLFQGELENGWRSRWRPDSVSTIHRDTL